ncbi:MAG: ubiquinol-cytochrome c reductase iron-sulfur subunit [Planctomycetota bacterium]|jgi:Rieske Fe-S protein|nr:ubiquinol-cytochrome c reductase iron-sulfur subunit [Planctomycetota bacterium]MDP6941274.1 ubiquinol-cytochrome c reductase iron-sulfur subunit [Planctomycetota bacterium]
MTEPTREPENPAADGTHRRSFLSRVSSLAMLGGLIAGYGSCGAAAGRFLYPAKPPSKRWQFVLQVTRLGRGEAMNYRAPNGETIVVARQGSGTTADNFIALSSTCPHLGCKVAWEAHNNRFFCPCHNGVFAPDGTGVSGPPADAGQSLSRYPLMVKNGLLFIEVALEGLA